MVSLEALPPEILMTITDHLNMFDREAMARTLSRALYAVARPGLDLGWISHARRMAARFDQDYIREEGHISLHAPPDKLTALPAQPSFPGHLRPFPFGAIRGFFYALPRKMTILPDKCISMYGLDPARAPYVRNSPPYLKDVLGLDGTFSWLTGGFHPKRPEEDSDEDDDIAQDPLMEEGGLKELQDQTTGLGLTLPAGFDIFVRSLKFRRRMEEASDWQWGIGTLVKCPASVDQGAGGYLLWFYGDSQACGDASIYLDPTGGHCVLGSAFHPETVDNVDLHIAFKDEAKTAGDDEDDENDASEIKEDGPRLSSEYIACAKQVIKMGGITRAEFEFARAHGLQVCLNWRREKYMLHAFSFEEFLATIYFEACIGCEPETEPGVKEYVARVFTPLSSE